MTKTMPDSARSTADLADAAGLDQREAVLNDLELELGFDYARLRAREGQVAEHRAAFQLRARQLDQRERRLRELAAAAGSKAELVGLGTGGALDDADVEGWVARSATLHLGRVAMLAAREEMVERRLQQQRSRADELALYEEAFARAEVRMVARERLVAKVAVQLQADAGRPSSSAVHPRIQPAAAPAQSTETPPPASHMPSSGRFRSIQQTGGRAEPVLVAYADAGAAGETLRHADTVALGPDEAAATTTVADQFGPRRKSRHVSEPIAPPDVPDDLPAAPLPPRGHRHATSPFLAVLVLAGHPVLRCQIEVDRSGATVLVSFPEQAPDFGDQPTFTYRAREGGEAVFPVELRRVIQQQPRGAVVVLSVAAWSKDEFDGFERALLQLL
jgi:hypothetical protein